MTKRARQENTSLYFPATFEKMKHDVKWVRTKYRRSRNMAEIRAPSSCGYAMPCLGTGIKAY